jgi:hypothetical protein
LFVSLRMALLWMNLDYQRFLPLNEYIICCLVYAVSGELCLCTCMNGNPTLHLITRVRLVLEVDRKWKEKCWCKHTAMFQTSGQNINKCGKIMSGNGTVKYLEEKSNGVVWS